MMQQGERQEEGAAEQAGRAGGDGGGRFGVTVESSHEGLVLVRFILKGQRARQRPAHKFLKWRKASSAFT